MRTHFYYPGGKDLENIGKGMHSAIGKARGSYDGARSNMRRLFADFSGIDSSSHTAQFMFEEKAAATLKPLSAKERRRVKSAINKRMEVLRKQKKQALANLNKSGKLPKEDMVSAAGFLTEALDIMTANEIPQFAERVFGTSIPLYEELPNTALSVLQYFNHLAGSSPISLDRHIDLFDVYLRDLAGQRVIALYKRIFRLYFGVEGNARHTIEEISTILGIRQSHLRQYMMRVANYLARNEELRREVFVALKEIEERTAQNLDNELASALGNTRIEEIISLAYGRAYNSRNAVYAFGGFKDGKFFVHKGCDNYPLMGINWVGAVTLCNLLSEMEGLEPVYNIAEFLDGFYCDFTKNGYRLPTEAEWEFAAKGGIKSKGYLYSGSDNPDDVAWYRENSGWALHPVGLKKPNELGIYDMSGNAAEICFDVYNSKYYSISVVDDPKGADNYTVKGGNADLEPDTGEYHLRRGGFYMSKTDEIRSSERIWGVYYCPELCTVRFVRNNL
jgi:formylglycine-generating enzyme required for sulfatase activity